MISIRRFSLSLSPSPLSWKFLLYSSIPFRFSSCSTTCAVFWYIYSFIHAPQLFLSNLFSTILLPPWNRIMYTRSQKYFVTPEFLHLKVFLPIIGIIRVFRPDRKQVLWKWSNKLRCFQWKNWIPKKKNPTIFKSSIFFGTDCTSIAPRCSACILYVQLSTNVRKVKEKTERILRLKRIWIEGEKSYRNFNWMVITVLPSKWKWKWKTEERKEEITEIFHLIVNRMMPLSFYFGMVLS